MTSAQPSGRAPLTDEGSFVRRHIGPTANDVSAMAGALGYG
jgi:hypothetical protein